MIMIDSAPRLSSGLAESSPKLLILNLFLATLCYQALVDTFGFSIFNNYPDMPVYIGYSNYAMADGRTRSLIMAVSGQVILIRGAVGDGLEAVAVGYGGRLKETLTLQEITYMVIVILLILILIMVPGIDIIACIG